MKGKYLNVDGFFSLPDDTDLEGLRFTDLLRIIADELDKLPDHVNAEKNQPTERDLLLLEKENKIHNEYYSLAWDRFWKTRKKGVHKNCYRNQVGEIGGKNLLFHRSRLK